jgi:hypothetical protein
LQSKKKAQWCLGLGEAPAKQPRRRDEKQKAQCKMKQLKTEQMTADQYI